jgi:type IV pilus assembly protein PilN
MKLSLNLASRSYVNQRALKQLYLALCLLFLLLLALQVKSYLQSRGEIGAAQDSLRELQQQLRGGAVTEQLTNEQIEKQLQQYQQARVLLQRDAFRWTALFDRLERVLPDGVSIRSLNPDYQQRDLVLIGVARGLPDLQKLLDNLHADSFQQVFLQNQDRIEVSAGAGDKKPALSFSIKLEGVF